MTIMRTNNHFRGRFGTRERNDLYSKVRDPLANGSFSGDTNKGYQLD